MVVGNGVVIALVLMVSRTTKTAGCWRVHRPSRVPLVMTGWHDSRLVSGLVWRSVAGLSRLSTSSTWPTTIVTSPRGAPGHGRGRDAGDHAVENALGSGSLHVRSEADVQPLRGGLGGMARKSGVDHGAEETSGGLSMSVLRLSAILTAAAFTEFRARWA